MQDRRYVFIIMDSTGRPLRRVGVWRRTVEVVVGAFAAVLVVATFALLHGLYLRSRAAETALLTRENDHLAKLALQLESRLPEVRRLALRGDLTFSQIWSKSGLGVEPRLLGVGPIEAEPDGVAGSAVSRPNAVSTSVLQLDPIGIPLELDRLEGDGRKLIQTLGELLEYFHDAERLLSNTPSIRPVTSPWLTSSFGKRHDPMSGQWMMHKGLDLGGRVGAEIIAPADGVVIWTGRRGGYGLTVVVDHGYGLQSHYAHLSRYRVNVGDRVRRGDVIAEVGSTGKSTGPHLHYEVRRYGQPLDPLRFILD